MDTFSHFVREAGWGIYPVFVLGSASLVAALRYMRTPRADVLAVVVALGVVTCLFGVLGTVTGLQASVNYIGELGADEKWIFLVGLREALNNMVAALMIVCVDGLIVTGALSVRLLTKSASAPARS